MSLPDELKKPIDEIKTASNRVLVTCLILAIIFQTGLSVNSNLDNKNEIKRLLNVNDALRQKIELQAAAALKKEMDDNARLSRRDSINNGINDGLIKSIIELKKRIK